MKANKKNNILLFIVEISCWGWDIRTLKCQYTGSNYLENKNLLIVYHLC